MLLWYSMAQKTKYHRDITPSPEPLIQGSTEPCFYRVYAKGAAPNKVAGECAYWSRFEAGGR